MKRKQKGFSPILAIIVVAIAVVVVVVFLSTQQTTQSVPVIQNASDLNTAASELDNTDSDELDRELNQLDADASTF